MLKKIRNLYFYGNVHIALAATLLTLGSYVILGAGVNMYYLSFVFGSTLAMYSAHRIIGLKRILPEEFDLRFHTISFNQKFIIAFLIIGSVISAISLLFLSAEIIMLILFSVPITIAYVLPIFSNQRRLRDFHFVKIFMIALVWAWICWLIPAWTIGSGSLVWLLFLELFLFIFAITLPFDIRDMKVDKAKQVITIPLNYGLVKTKNMAITMLLLSTVISIYLFAQSNIDFMIVTTIAVVDILAAFLVRESNQNKSDLYFTGWIDGLIVIRGLGIWLLSLT